MPKMPDDRASDSQIYTNTSNGGEEPNKQSHGGLAEAKQTPASKVKGEGGSKVAEASQSAKDQY